MGISYITREDLVSALGDNSPQARGTASVDRAIESGSRAVDALCHRVFYPTTGVRTVQRMPGDRLFLDTNEVISLSALSMDGTALGVDAWTLSPTVGPPYTSIVFPNGPSLSYDGDLILTGVFGACDDQVSAGAAAEAMDAVETDLDVTDGSLIGVGDLLKIDSERFLVVGRTWLTTAQTVQTPLTASAANTTVAVTTGSAYHVGEFLLLDSEQMLITDIAGNNLVVKRAMNGTVLATHTGSTVFASRTLLVTRGVQGSTAATHLTAAPITKLQAPALVRALALAEAIDRVLQEAGGYARTVGAGDNARPASGGGLDPLRAQCYAAHGRKGRLR